MIVNVLESYPKQFENSLILYILLQTGLPLDGFLPKHFQSIIWPNIHRILNVK